MNEEVPSCHWPSHVTNRNCMQVGIRNVLSCREGCGVMYHNCRSMKGQCYRINPCQVPGCDAILKSQKFFIYKTPVIHRTAKCDKVSRCERFISSYLQCH